MGHVAGRRTQNELASNANENITLMKMENAIRIMAGTMILLSLALTRWVHPNWVWLTVFVAVNLIQSAVTGFCPAANILRRLGVGRGGSSCCE